MLFFGWLRLIKYVLQPSRSKGFGSYSSVLRKYWLQPKVLTMQNNMSGGKGSAADGSRCGTGVGLIDDGWARRVCRLFGLISWDAVLGGEREGIAKGCAREEKDGDVWVLGEWDSKQADRTCRLAVKCTTWVETESMPKAIEMRYRVRVVEVSVHERSTDVVFPWINKYRHGLHAMQNVRERINDCGRSIAFITIEYYGGVQYST